MKMKKIFRAWRGQIVATFAPLFPVAVPLQNSSRRRWDTMSRHWREAGASDQRQRGNAADTHAVSLVERELPSATYLERFHPSVSVRGSNCLQKFASAIARLGWYRRAQRSSRIRNTIDRFLVAQQNRACTSIHENSHVITLLVGEKLCRVI